MSYRGEDLDLRTPQSRGGRDGYPGADAGANGGMNGTRHRSPVNAGGRGDALLVDDTVLACCNHAYDVAHAHGASEVRLEHLVHALTRVEAAAEILEQRGIREAHLRRESAAVIASEIPVGLAHSHAAPRSSVEFEDVLRRSTEQARGRGAPSSVHDLLWILLNYNREIPAIALLLRHAADWQSWDWPHKVDARREDYREPTRPQTSYYNERRTFAEPAPPPPRTEPAPAMYTPSVNLDPVHQRLDQMDQAFRKLQSDLMNERRGMADTIRDSMRDMLREMGPQRGGAVSLPAGLMDRFDGVERMERMFDQRLQSLEKSVTSGMQEGARNWAAMGDRLKSFDSALSQHPGAANSGLADLVTEQLITVTGQVQAATDKLERLERMFETRQGENQRTWSVAMEKFKSLEDGLVSFRRDGSGVQTTLNDRFQGVHQKLEQQDLATASLVAQLSEPMMDRLRQLEGSVQRQIETLAQRPGGDTGMAERIERIVNERVGRLDQTVTTGQQAVTQTYQLTTQLGERLRAIEAQATSQPQAAQALTAKLAHLEQLVQSHGDRAVQYTQQVAQQAADAHVRELADLQEAVVKLGTNQQALAENLDQWRNESEGGISIVSNRLEGLEVAANQPVQILKQMQTDMQALQQVTIADYDQNRRGVRNWLFGTDEIFAGTWRDETRQIRDRLRQMRTDERKA
jgi:hypothetical protein